MALSSLLTVGAVKKSIRCDGPEIFNGRSLQVQHSKLDLDNQEQKRAKQV